MSSEANLTALQADTGSSAREKTIFKVLLAISFCHLLNDTVQSLLPAIYPLLRNSFHLDFGQVGLIAFTSTFTASLLQPLVGLYSDRHPKPYFLAAGMGITAEEFREQAISRVPLGEIVEPEEVAELALFLALTIIYFICIGAGSGGSWGRFRVPVEPLYAFCAATGGAAVLQRLRRRAA